MKKAVLTLNVLLIVTGVALAQRGTFSATIVRVGDDKVVILLKDKEKGDRELPLRISPNLKVFQGKPRLEKGEVTDYERGEEIKEGLKHPVFAKIKGGLHARLVVDDDKGDRTLLEIRLIPTNKK